VLSIDYFPTNTKEALQAVADADASGTNRSQPAFLQFTSGSTSEPKGVIISHGNLAHNLSLIIDGLQASEDTVRSFDFQIYIYFTSKHMRTQFEVFLDREP
jgi:long-subunit acyl-CoA synthetase (AMP-forming)